MTTHFLVSSQLSYSPNVLRAHIVGVFATSLKQWGTCSAPQSSTGWGIERFGHSSGAFGVSKSPALGATKPKCTFEENQVRLSDLMCPWLALLFEHKKLNDAMRLWVFRSDLLVLSKILALRCLLGLAFWLVQLTGRNLWCSTDSSHIYVLVICVIGNTQSSFSCVSRTLCHNWLLTLIWCNIYILYILYIIIYIYKYK